MCASVHVCICLFCQAPTSSDVVSSLLSIGASAAWGNRYDTPLVGYETKLVYNK